MSDINGALEKIEAALVRTRIHLCDRETYQNSSITDDVANALKLCAAIRVAVPDNLGQALKLASKDKHVWDFHERLEAAKTLQKITNKETKT